jgi:molecular chaperone IbpA
MKDFWNAYTESTNIDRFFVGSDLLAKMLTDNVARLSNTSLNGTYPPFNLKKVEDNKYVIEIAVAGFSKRDIELTLEDNKLSIKGDISADTKDQTQTYIHKGIAARGFTRCFTLADNLEINNAEMLNGMLTICLEHNIPESKKPKKIDIKESVGASTETVTQSEK